MRGQPPRPAGLPERGLAFGRGLTAGIGLGSLVAPAVSVLGLVLIALLTVSLFTGKLPCLEGCSTPRGGAGPDRPDPNVTAAPSNVVNVPTPSPPSPGASAPPTLLGSIVFAKQGNIWVESGSKATQITDTGRDSMPSWSPDGQWVYFIETASQRGLFPSLGTPRYYTLTYPILERVHPNGSGREKLLTGLYRAGGGAYQWFYWVREPVVSPDGHTIALVSDGPDPTRNDVVLQFFDTKTGKLTQAPVAEDPPLGHQDVVWRPDGNQLLYVRNSRDASRGAPSIWTYDPITRHSKALTGPGYTSPAFSPDGRWIAATKTSSFGTDVVIMNAKTGTEVLRLTDDGQSWSPVWSPAGDSIAFLHISYQIVDLRSVPLKGRAPSWTLGDPINLTQYSGLDGSSRPGWYIAPADLPASTASPSGSSAASSAGAGSSGGAGSSDAGASASP